MSKKIIASVIIFMLIIMVGCTGVSKEATIPKLAKTENKNVRASNDLESKFTMVSTADTNFCAGPAFISQKLDDERLQGSCCSAMDFHRYKEQVLGLKKYSNINQIPPDPYDISVSLAKELLSYDKNIKLTAEQQAIYDDAVQLSHEGGPCCCVCWRWYAFRGLAKLLITQHGFNAEQVADVWDLLDGCGGKGHEHGVHT